VCAAWWLRDKWIDRVLNAVSAEVLMHSRRHVTAMSYVTLLLSCSDETHGQFHCI